MLIKPLPSQMELRSWFDYNSTTGILTWRRGREYGHAAGTITKHKCGVTLKVQLCGKKYAASRIIWKWVTGNEPVALIDHSDNNQLNNSWSNLREATSGQNTANRKKHSGTKNTLKGTWWNTYGWAAGVTINGKQTFLGNFATEQEAHDAYVAASRQIHGAFHRPR